MRKNVGIVSRARWGKRDLKFFSEHSEDFDLMRIQGEKK